MSLYWVMLVALVVWIGLFLYLWRVDARVKEMEKRWSAKATAAAPEAPEAVLEKREGTP